MKKIKRTFLQSTITACKIRFVNGKPEQENLPTVVTFDTVNEKNAEKIYKKLSDIDKKTQIFIVDISTTEICVAMSSEDFMKYGTVIKDTDVEALENEYLEK